MADHEPSKSIWNRRNALSSIWSRGCAGIDREDPARYMPAYSMVFAHERLATQAR